MGAGSQAYLSWSMCWSASYMQKGLSMVVHSFMNSMEPPVSAEMSQMASSLHTGQLLGADWFSSDQGQRSVAPPHPPVGQHWRTLRGRWRHVRRPHQLLGVEAAEQPRRVAVPVDAVDQAGGVGRHLRCGTGVSGVRAALRQARGPGGGSRWS